MKIKSLRLALYRQQPGVPNRGGLQRQSLRRANPHQGNTTSAGDTPPVSSDPERRARGMKIFEGTASGLKDDQGLWLWSTRILRVATIRSLHESTSFLADAGNVSRC